MCCDPHTPKIVLRDKYVCQDEECCTRGEGDTRPGRTDFKSGVEEDKGIVPRGSRILLPLLSIGTV
jgi:hypothetical protein